MNKETRKIDAEIKISAIVAVATMLTNQRGFEQIPILLRAVDDICALTGAKMPSLLETLEFAEKGVETEITEDRQWLTAKEIGKKVGLSAIKTNLVLSAIGLQTKNDDGTWARTELGKTLSRGRHVGPEGRPYKQVVWKPDVFLLLPAERWAEAVPQGGSE